MGMSLPRASTRRVLVAALAVGLCATALPTAVANVGGGVPETAAQVAPPAKDKAADKGKGKKKDQDATPEQEPLPDLDAIDPVRYSYEEAVRESVQVPSRNGVDLIWVDIIRPKTEAGEKVPTIMMASPYFNTLGRGWRGELKTPHQGPSNPGLAATRLLGAGTVETPYPEWYDEYFVPRGYAFAAMDLRGTRNTSGCQTYGDRDEVTDGVDVVDWIADQDWSNGKVGMTGGSYDGTIANGVAAEQPMSGRHPDALGAIIPIRSIGRWYDYHFFNGVQSSSHLLTPALFTAALAGLDTQNSGTDDLLLPVHLAERKACIATFGALVDAGYASPYQDARAPFWRERDFLRSAGNNRAATFVIHGLFDYNVKTNNAGYQWESLAPTLPKKLWLMNGDHVDPHVPTAEDARNGRHILPFPFQDKFIEANHRWWLQYLKGVEAGAQVGPEVEVQRADGTWEGDDVFPAATGDQVLSLTADGTAVEGAAPDGEVTYRDGPTGGSAPAQRVFVTEPFAQDTRLSGQIAFDLEMAAEGVDTTVAIDVVDVPPGIEPTARSTDLADGSFTAPLRISEGWARAFYRDSVPLRGLSTPTGGAPLEPGERTGLEFGSLYTDVVVPAGHRLAFKVSNSAGGTVAANTGGVVTLFTGADGSRVLLPVVDEP
jgi:X-Pro dipeptidyl-peptidase